MFCWLADTGEVFTAPIMTALRFVNFRLPFTSFRYGTGGQGPAKLDPSRLVRLSVRSVLCHWQCPLAAKSMQRGRQFVGACLFHLQSCFGADIARIRRWRALSEILSRCRYDYRPAKLPSVVKPGDLGLMFSDSCAKDFTIEIDRVKVSLLSASTAGMKYCPACARQASGIQAALGLAVTGGAGMPHGLAGCFVRRAQG